MDVTVAVNVSNCPKADGFADEVSVVVVPIMLFVKLKLTGVITPAALTVTLYEPAILLAIAATLAAPPEIVAGLPESAALAPLAGVVKTICPLSTGSLKVLVTATTSVFGKAVFICAL